MKKLEELLAGYLDNGTKRQGEMAAECLALLLIDKLPELYYIGGDPYNMKNWKEVKISDTPRENKFREFQHEVARQMTQGVIEHISKPPGEIISIYSGRMIQHAPDGLYEFTSLAGNKKIGMIYRHPGQKDPWCATIPDFSTGPLKEFKLKSVEMIARG